MVQASVQLPNSPRGFVPVSPATALKVIFIKNMGLSLEQISVRAGVNILTLQNIESGKSKVDEQTGEKLRRAFGAAADLLLKLQMLHSHYEITGELAPMETFQKGRPSGLTQGM